jgi:hypothetical protein
MTRQFTVSCRDSSSAERSHRATLASLPGHFRVVSDGPADAAYASFQNPLAGVRAVVFDAAEQAQMKPAVFAIPAWSYLPRLEADACFVEACTRPYGLITCVTAVAEGDERYLRSALLEQLAILRRFGSADPSISVFQRDAKGYLAVVKIGQAMASLIGRVSPLAQDELQLQAVGANYRFDIAMDAVTLARPAIIRLFGAEGAREAMPVHQSSHRLTWLKVHALLSGLISTSDLVLAHALDVAAVSQAFDAA